MSTSNKRGPNGRALNKNGTERKERVTLTPYQRAQRRMEQRKNDMQTLGRGILKGVDTLKVFLAGISKVKGYSRLAKEYGTEEKRAAKRAYFEAQIDAIEGKGVIAEEYLSTSGDTLARIDGIEAKVGEDIYAWMENNGEPTQDDMANIVRNHITDEDIAFVEGASDPENNPFAKYQRDAVADSDSSDEL